VEKNAGMRAKKLDDSTQRIRKTSSELVRIGKSNKKWNFSEMRKLGEGR